MSKQHMKKIGTEARTDFTRSSLPACVIKVAIRAKLFATLLTIGRHCSTVGLYNPKGNPRYVNGMDPTVQPRRSPSSLHLSGGVLIGAIVDL